MLSTRISLCVGVILLGLTQPWTLGGGWPAATAMAAPGRGGACRSPLQPTVLRVRRTYTPPARTPGPPRPPLENAYPFTRVASRLVPARRLYALICGLQTPRPPYGPTTCVGLPVDYHLAFWHRAHLLLRAHVGIESCPFLYVGPSAAHGRVFYLTPIDLYQRFWCLLAQALNEPLQDVFPHYRGQPARKGLWSCQ